MTNALATDNQTRTVARVVESLVIRGDISALTPDERSSYYLQMCESLGLSAASQPFAVLKLNGKEILYPTRGATDQLAAIHRLNREIVDGPRLMDVAGMKMIYAVCRATHPNGRVETAVATVPAADLINALMKCETKAKRRATLSILGLGMLDETEIETIPNARTAEFTASPKAPTRHDADGVVETDAEPVAVDRQTEVERRYQSGPMTPQAAPSETRDPRSTPEFLALVEALAQAVDLPSVVAAWCSHGATLGQVGSDVLAEAQRETLAAWQAFGGGDRASLIAAIKAERAAEVAPPDTAPRSRRRAAAPPAGAALSASHEPVIETIAEWRALIASRTNAGHIAGGYHKRADRWRRQGELAEVRAVTVDRLCALLPADESQASAYLDGCAPGRRQSAAPQSSVRRRPSESTTPSAQR